MTDQELTPREHAIVELAVGRTPAFVAASLGVDEQAVRRLGGLLG